jgi:hypothetical protein
MQLPFDGDVVGSFAGKPMVLSRGTMHTNRFYPLLDIIFEQDGTISVDGLGKWETQAGTLRLLDKRGGLHYEFRALETRNGVVYAMGRSVISTTHDGFERVTLHEKKTMPGVGVCISSTASYADITLPVLFKSLKKAGFNMANVFVSVGGDTKDDGKETVDPKYGVKIFKHKYSRMGYTALMEFGQLACLPYWLLLHDTCAVTEDSLKKLAEVDVGMNPDIVLLRPPEERNEIGFYSSEFIQTSVDMPSDLTATNYLSMMVSRASVVSILNSPWLVELEQDIYGTGNKRETLLFSSLGIKKFKGKDTGKP